ncbi:hypothetical protein M7I_7496 [Glarea lozoyensis 74030]|uniref:Uncharacterized protein n=1 Tax=Glarea lozoyensis (strain ATCC 74030 / MF5533) TaxID=1104152 RepID=H0EXG1_GLAL7|nr:hypothetical protein M7I_7496 [Glarea lozoyensis 74030]
MIRVSPKTLDPEAAMGIFEILVPFSLYVAIKGYSCPPSSSRGGLPGGQSNG